MSIEVLDFDQCSPQWFEARRGIPTASEFSSVLAKGEGKTRLSYMRKLASEIITGEVGENFTTPAMERGKQMEVDARDLYAFIDDVPLQQVGFIRNGQKGCSPDSLAGTNGALEIKTQRGDLLIDTLFKDAFPPEHKAQCQGVLWIAEREWIDLVVYWPRMPLFVKRAYRDEAYIKALESEVAIFNGDLAAMVARIRSYGRREAA